MAFGRTRLIVARTCADGALLKLHREQEFDDFNRQRRSLEKKKNGAESRTNVYYKQMYCRGNIEGVSRFHGARAKRKKNERGKMLVALVLSVGLHSFFPLSAGENNGSE